MLKSLEKLLNDKAEKRGIYYALSVYTKRYTKSHVYCDLSAHLIRDNRRDPLKIKLLKDPLSIIVPLQNKTTIKIHYNTLFKILHLNIGDYRIKINQIQVEGMENLITRILNIYLLKN